MKPSSHRFNPSLRRLVRTSLAASLILLASVATARAQALSGPYLRFETESIIAEGTSTYLWVIIENPQIQTWWRYGEPSILTISSPQMPEPAEGMRWNGVSRGVSGDFPPSPPGLYDVVATSSGSAWSAQGLADGNTAESMDQDLFLTGANLLELSVTKQLTVVGITSLTADRYHVADGDTVTFTAAMTPQNAFQFIYWDGWGPFCNQGGGGTYQWQATRGGRAQTNGVVAVTAMCGTKTISVPITVYQLTNATASSNLITTADPVTLTAQFDPDPGTNNLGVAWFESIGGVFGIPDPPRGAGHSLSLSNLAIGQHTFYAQCGSAISYVTVTVNFGGTIDLSATLEDIPIMTSSILTATLTPGGTPNSIAWQHPEHNLSDVSGGFTRDYFFQHSGTQPVTITCDGITATKAIRVYEVTGLSANPSLVAVGSNVTFTATLYGGTNPPPLTWVVDGAVDTNSTGVTFTTSFPTAGVKEVSAWCGPLSYKSSLVTNVGIASVTMTSPDTVGPITPNGVQYIYQNDNVSFTAYPNPSNALWPSNQPQWLVNGTATSGSNASVTFSALSTSISNFQTAVVTCGTSTSAVSCVVFKCELTIGPEDNFPGRTLLEFGVGEVLGITNAVVPSGLSPATLNLGWSAMSSNNTSFQINSSGTTATLSGITFPETVQVQLLRFNMPLNQISRSLASTNLPFIMPTGISYAPLTRTNTTSGWATSIGLTNLPADSTWHVENSISAGCMFRMLVTPTNVSWREIETREGTTNYEADGCLAFLNQTPHREQPWNRPTNFFTIGWKAGFDKSSIGAFTPSTFPMLNAIGTGGWVRATLPLEYRVPSGPYPNISAQFSTVDFRADVNAAGDTVARKQTTTFRAGFADPTSSYPPVTIVP